MKTNGRAIIFALALLLPRVVNASELQFTLIEPFVDFGSAGAHFDSFGFDDLFLDGMFLETPSLSSFQGDVTIDTEPGPSVTIDDSDPDLTQSSYDFGPGIFTLTVYSSGTPIGRYVAPVLDLQIDVTCEQELSALDCGDEFGESHGPLFVTVGPGEFDSGLAAALGLKRQGGGFAFELFLNGISGSPSDRLRLAGSAGGQLDLAIPVEIPEPSIISLLLLAPALSRRFRR